MCMRHIVPLSLLLVCVMGSIAGPYNPVFKMSADEPDTISVGMAWPVVDYMIGQEQTVLKAGESFEGELDPRVGWEQIWHGSETDFEIIGEFPELHKVDIRVYFEGVEMVIVEPRDEPYTITSLGDHETNTPFVISHTQGTLQDEEDQFGPVNTVPNFYEAFKNVDWVNPLKVKVTNYGEDATLYRFQVNLRMNDSPYDVLTKDFIPDIHFEKFIDTNLILGYDRFRNLTAVPDDLVLLTDSLDLSYEGATFTLESDLCEDDGQLRLEFELSSPMREDFALELIRSDGSAIPVTARPVKGKNTYEYESQMML